MNPGDFVEVLCINNKKYTGNVLSINDGWVTMQDEKGCVFVINLIHIVSVITL